MFCNTFKGLVAFNTSFRKYSSLIVKTLCSSLYLELGPDQLAKYSSAALHNVLGHCSHDQSSRFGEVGHGLGGGGAELVGALQRLGLHLQGGQCNNLTPSVAAPTIGYFHQIGPLGRFDLVVAMSVCVCVCVSVCVSVPFRVVYFEAHFAPTSRSRMSKIFRDSESLGKTLERSGLRIKHFCWKVV